MALVAVVITLLGGPTCVKAKTTVNDLRTQTNYLRDVMDQPHYLISSRHYACNTYRTGFLPHLWGFRLKRTRVIYNNPPRLTDWLCIFRGENAGYGWHVNTGNGYYGGLQMDLEFQDTYASKLLKLRYHFNRQTATGTADKWTWLEQIWTAIRAYSSGRGYYPWPTTAANCGLI